MLLGLLMILLVWLLYGVFVCGGLYSEGVLFIGYHCLVVSFIG